MTKLFDGIKIGHYNDEHTGVSVILLENGCVCGVNVRGGAPGTKELALLSDDKANNRVDALTLCGGSAYGLEASFGVMEYLKNHGLGFPVLDKIVPIVPSAVIYDLNDKDYHYPTKEYGYLACENATDSLENGSIGAGKGATIGKVLGINNSQKSGICHYEVTLGDIKVIAILVVNAFGDVVKNGKIIAGANINGNFVDTENLLLNASETKLSNSNTTIGCILTNARLTKSQCNRVAKIAHNGLARSIYPVHTQFDGDTIFCLSTATKEVENPLLIEVASVKAVENAVWSLFN